MFEKLFSFDSVGLLFNDEKRDQLYFINVASIHKQNARAAKLEALESGESP